MTGHHVGEKSDHQCERLSEDAYKLDDGNQRECFQRHRHIGPEDVFPVVLRAAELRDDEGTQSEEECDGDVAGHIAATRWKRNDTHQVAGEDEEETRQQIR